MPDEIQRLISSIRNIIKEKISLDWLKGAGEPARLDVNVSQYTGATDAITFEVDTELKFFLKFPLEDAKKEKEGHTTLFNSSSRLAEHLIHPLFDIDEAIIPVPLVSGRTLHEIVESVDSEWIRSMYINYLNAMSNLWSKTALDSPAPIKSIYTNRIIDRIPHIKDGFKRRKDFNIDNTELIVNGTSYGTFQDVIREFRALSRRCTSPYSVTIHGDEHANNIMVYNDAVGLNDAGWVVIDYVNVTAKGDWVFSIAKMLHWWQVYYVIELAKSNEDLKKSLKSKYQVSRKQNEISLLYSEDALSSNIPRICNELEEKVWKLARNVAKAFKEKDEDWERRLRLALFTILFGGASRHFDQENQFAIPILMGEGIKHLISET